MFIVEACLMSIVKQSGRPRYLNINDAWPRPHWIPYVIEVTKENPSTHTSFFTNPRHHGISKQALYLTNKTLSQRPLLHLLLAPRFQITRRPTRHLDVRIPTTSTQRIMAMAVDAAIPIPLEVHL